MLFRSFIERNTADGIQEAVEYDEPPAPPDDLLSYVTQLDNCPPDLAIRSSSGEVFRAHKVVLSLASPVLSAQIEAESPAGLDPALDLPESSFQVTLILRACYGLPIVNVDGNDAGMLLRIYDYARLTQKYKLIHATTQARLSFKCLFSTCPLRGYFLAASLGWKEEAKAAARIAVSDVTVDVENAYLPEMENLPAVLYRNLLEYNQAIQSARDVVTQKYSTRTLDMKHYPNRNPGHYENNYDATIIVPTTYRPNSETIHVAIASREFPLGMRRTNNMGNLISENRAMHTDLEDAVSQVEVCRTSVFQLYKDSHTCS